MQFTNKLNLTEPLFKALQWDDYDPGKADYTPSSLARPPYMAALERNHKDSIVVDVADNVWALLGKATHKIIEIGTAGMDNNFAEKRVYIKVGKWDISAQLDNLFVDAENQILEDHKTTTVYKFKPDFKGTLPEAKDWDTQLNIIAYILRHEFWFYVGASQDKTMHQPIPIKTLRINGILKDHRQVLARFDKDYPQHPLAVREFTIWDDEKVEAYITERAMAQDKAKASEIDDIIPCTDEEMWATPDKWAIMKHGNKKAVKLFESMSALTRFSDTKELVFGTKKGDHYTEFRAGERKRCQAYCPAGKNGFCTVWNKFQESGE